MICLKILIYWGIVTIKRNEQLQDLYANYSPKRLLDLKVAVENKTATLMERKEFGSLLSFERIRTYTNFVKSMNYDIDWQWFHKVVMTKIDEIIASPTSKRLMIEMPPRHCKTLLAGQFLSTYLFGRFPNKSIVYATAVNPKAVEEAANMRNIITSERYQDLFPGAKVKSSFEDSTVMDKRTKKNKRDTATILSNVYSERGGIRTVGMGDILTGHPFHFGIADDLYKGYAEAQSDKIRENIWKWFVSVFLTRADKKTVGGVAHIIMFFTRWHDDDACGRLQRMQTESRDEIEALEELGIEWYDWEVISFEAIRTAETKGHSSDNRAIGEPLWKIYEPEYHAQRILNPLGFEAMYQGHPINQFDKLFERSFFQEYDRLPENITRIIIGIDPNLKEGKNNASLNSKDSSDNFAIVVHGMSGKNIYLLDWIGKSKDYGIFKNEVWFILQKYPHYLQIIIEQTASGPALTHDLKTKGVYRLVEFETGSKSKYERASLIVPEMKQGFYFVPTRRLRPDIDHYITQFVNFTGEKGRHDDFVDATVSTLLWYLQHPCVISLSDMCTFSNNQVPRILPKNVASIANLLPVNRNNPRGLHNRSIIRRGSYDR
jgi:predicted phage terminase large subunit-like protein